MSSDRSSRSETQILALLAVVLLSLCCCLFSMTGGLVYSLGLAGISPPVQTSSPTRVFSTRTPTPARTSTPLRTPQPTGIPAPLEIVPFRVEQETADIPLLTDLAPGWQPTNELGTRTWAFNIPADQPVLIWVGWCAEDQTTAINALHDAIWYISVDGQPAPINELYVFRQLPSSEGEYCLHYVGMLSSWTPGEHTIEVRARLLNSLYYVKQPGDVSYRNYPYGDYVDVFYITVTP